MTPRTSFGSSGQASLPALAQFREARNADYDALTADAHAAMKAARSAAAVSELAAVHARLTRRLEEIRRIDYFEAERRKQAEEAIAAIEKRLRKDRKEETRMLKVNRELRGRTWVTRPGVKIDRMASEVFWTMTGPLGSEERQSQDFKTADGGTARLRFTRFNVSKDQFESRMDYTEDGGKTWKPGNHQTFRRSGAAATISGG